jgi:cation:H+ antiporter
MAARFFTEAAERVGLRLGMSPFVVGVLIVAIGTSLPELVASVLSALAGSSEIVAGNVIGANVTNLLLTLGAVAVIAPAGRIVLGERYLFIDLHFLLGATVALGVSMADGDVSRVEGVLLLTGYLAYVAYLLIEGRTTSAELAHDEALPAASRSLPRDLGLLLAMGVLIFLSGEQTVIALGTLADRLDIEPAIASLLILSIGTTLPELAVSLSAARQGQAAMAVGNILGSFVFNAFMVMGVAALIGGVQVPDSLRSFPLPFLAASALLFYLLTMDKRISRWEGLLFIVLYALYLIEVAGLG